ncbi:MAG TPA: hypothetical protein VFR37_22545 [Longimicrobium sp.]|nr:hypothetical protein [Longimicrobium sp.]
MKTLRLDVEALEVTTFEPQKVELDVGAGTDTRPPYCTQCTQCNWTG